MHPIFRPYGTCALACTAASGRVALPALPSAAMTRTAYLYNVGPNDAFVEFGDGTVVATAGGTVTAAADGSMCLPAGVLIPVQAIGASGKATHMAGICAAGESALIRVTAGEGF